MQTYRAPVQIDAQKQVLRRIRELTRQDFPENTIQIDDNGWIRKSTQ
jgi:hypothetical protein